MAALPRTKGRPRKRQPKPGERVPLGLRVTPSLKDALDRAAKQSGRSQSQEAEFRIERSFLGQDNIIETMELAYGREGAAVLAMAGEVIRAIGFWAPQIAVINKETTGRWLDDPLLFDEIVGVLNMIFRRLRPRGDAVPPKNFAAVLDAIGQKTFNALLANIDNPNAGNSSLTRSGDAEKIQAKLGKISVVRLMASPDGSKALQSSS